MKKRSATNPRFPLTTIILYLLSILLVYLTIVPRATEVISGNYLFGFDQGRDYLAVRDIVVNHKFTLIGAEIGAGSAGINGIFQGPFHYYFLTIPFIIFNGDPYGGVVLMLIFGILSIGTAFLLGRATFGTIFGIITAIFVAISPPLISQSRFVWNSHPSTFFILLCFYFFYRYLKDKRLLFLFLASFFAAFTYNFEIADAIPLCLGVFLYTVVLINKKIPKELLALFGGFIIGFMPMILFEIRHNFMAVRSIFPYLSGHSGGVATPFGMQFSSVFQSFLYNVQNTFPPQASIEIYLFFLFIILPAIYFVIKEKNISLKHFIIFLLILPVINFFVFFQLKNAVWQYYLIGLNLTYIFLTTYVFYSVFLSKNLYIKVVPVVLFVVIIFFAVTSQTKTFLYDYKDYGGVAKVNGLKDAFDYIYRDAHGKPFGLFFFSPPIYTYQYDYMKLWYGQDKFHYLPTQSKSGVFYLLIDKDPDKPWTYKGWMETVIKTGKVVWTKTLPSGFIVQKRIGNT